MGTTRPIRIGAAGGLGTPASVAAAFAIGAAYVVTGSVNQARVEAGPRRRRPRRCSPRPSMADVVMAPAADMFELGVKVQVLKRGTMFAAARPRSTTLYRRYDALEAIPAAARERLEKRGPRASRSTRCGPTRATTSRQRDPREVERADGRSEAPDGARVPLVPRPARAAGRSTASARPRARLPDLVRPGDGRVQRLGARELRPPQGDVRPRSAALSWTAPPTYCASTNSRHKASGSGPVSEQRGPSPRARAFRPGTGRGAALVSSR